MKTAQLRQWDNEHVWHPFAPMQDYRDEGAPIIQRGDGFTLIDTEGEHYLDGISSLWCNIHGHRVEQIDRAIRDQLEQIGHSTLLGLGNQPSIELAHELVLRTPNGLNKVFYSDSGATAVEAALKIAVQYHRQKTSAEKRNRFISLSGAYHGDTIGSVSVGRIDQFHAAFDQLLFETLRVPTPVTFRVPDGFERESYLEHCYKELEQCIDENGKQVAAFIIEPLVQGAAGILVHPPGYLKRVRELTARHGILLIADEVAVGFGRTGTLFACEQEHVCPDLLCLAKGLTGGYLPVAATLCTDEIYEAFLGEPCEGKTFYHGHTYTGNPLGCAAASASLKLFDENHVLENVAENAQRLQNHLAVLRDHPHVGEIRQKGIMVGIELVQSRSENVPFPSELRMGHRVTLAARRRNVIIRPLGDVLVLMPAPAMPGELIDTLCDVIIQSIEEVMAW
ncbi:MAG: adenosylmethionine--8-amino-7-oxononanoate transaminase [Planctomycetes bacterium]|nr:adenosylmethionine--8-amino-7-oxononanoate transaminase [Planctomycetota bacterium]